MDRKTAENLIRQYFQSWLDQNLELFLSTMTENVEVTECYGPVYLGANEVRQWFVNWHNGDGKGRVTGWDIINILYDDAQGSAAIEWDFECVFQDNQAGFLGCSLFQFQDRKINKIQEYSMDKDQYRPYKS